MGEIQDSEAKTHLRQLQDDVERGELIIMRPQQEIDSAIASITAIRKPNGKITFEELRSAREDGRKC